MNEIQIHTILESAREFAAEGKLLHAAQLYHRVMHALPTLDEPYLRLSQIYLEMGRVDLAEKMLGAGQTRNPDNTLFVRLLGESQLQRGAFADALSTFRSLAHRRMPDVHFHLGLAYLHLGQLSRAEAEFQTTILLDERWPRAHEALGEVFMRRKNFDGAIRELERGVQIDPYSGIGHRLLGVALTSRLELSRAIEHLILAVDIDPKDAEAWQLCGDVLLRMRRFEEAEPYLTKALKLNPRSAETSICIGFLCLHRGDRAKALQAFNRALELQPGHPRAVDGKLQLNIQRT